MLCVGVVGAIRASLPARSRVVRMDGILDPNPPMARQDARELAEKLNPVIGFYDPLGLSSANFWEKGNDFTYGWIRQAEIKHGRVAMAAFVGYLVQASGTHWAFPLHRYALGAGGTETLAYTPGLSPPEQWDALPLEARWQIVLFVGFLEWWSEFAPEVHYTKGGKPGYFPPFDDRKTDNRIGQGFGWPNPFAVPPLYQPFGPANFFPNPLKGKGLAVNPGEPSAEEKERGLLIEINNGRLAMIGIMGFLAEAKVPGAVPFLEGKIKAYAGEVMSPFEPVTVAVAAGQAAASAAASAAPAAVETVKAAVEAAVESPAVEAAGAAVEAAASAL